MPDTTQTESHLLTRFTPTDTALEPIETHLASQEDAYEAEKEQIKNAASTSEMIELKWNEDPTPIPRPLCTLRLTDKASVSRQNWSSCAHPQTDFTLSVNITRRLPHQSDADALLQLLDEAEEAVNALRRILGGE